MRVKTEQSSSMPNDPRASHSNYHCYHVLGYTHTRATENMGKSKGQTDEEASKRLLELKHARLGIYAHI